MVEEVIRTKTGMQGFDKALQGGFPDGNVILISGGAGTGKSTLCLQFAVNGASLFGEKSLYVSTEQNKEELYKQAAGFGWNIEDLENKHLMKIIYFDITGGDSFLEKLDAVIMEFQPKRLVIDSLTTLTDSLMVSGIGEDKGFSMVQIAETVNPIPRTEQIVSKGILYRLFKEVKKHKLTTLMTTELPEDHKQLSADGVSEFIADGVVVLRAMTVGDSSSRNLEVKKMRYSPIEGGLKSYSFVEDGIVVE
ncbi:MAG: AAA family ATPase [Candidatus Diapherotrites archaeon]|jgi:circadian clock protein KaiC|uniref:AAA family ATPase n=1 Tax=Candidatus Iainarchaeum sp. TaxID=3101447 RepID=A0A8T5GEA4_9ARCH|nr:AAA family ATPase [Candidatus Diapherotrites archaeon]